MDTALDPSHPRSTHSPAPLGKRLPTIDLLYWIMIISANTIGESGGDLSSMSSGLGYAAPTLILTALFAVAVAIGVYLRVQHLSLYWIIIILSSTAGTTASDLLTRNLLGTVDEPAYGATSLLLIGTLVVIFLAWHFLVPRTHITDPLNKTAQWLYWAAILTSSTLGTAFGDFISDFELTDSAKEHVIAHWGRLGQLIAEHTPLHFLGGTILLLSVLAVLVLLSLVRKISRDVLYWLAIVVTHPLGATTGDFMTKPSSEDGPGLNLGNFKATAILVGIFLLIVVIKQFVRPEKRKTIEGPQTTV